MCIMYFMTLVPCLATVKDFLFPAEDCKFSLFITYMDNEKKTNFSVRRLNIRFGNMLQKARSFPPIFSKVCLLEAGTLSKIVEKTPFSVSKSGVSIY